MSKEFIKVAIVTNKMVFGGIEKALIFMVNEMNSSGNFEITVFVIEEGGELKNELQCNVERILGEGDSIKDRLKLCIKQKNYSSIFRIIKGILNNLGKRQNPYVIWSNLLPINKKYFDIAISYSTPASFSVIYTINNLKARKKLAWIHADVSKYNIPKDPYDEYYCKYNNIFCVSKESLKNFINRYPNLSSNSEVFYNIVQREEINKLANAECFDSNYINIVTVGRLAKEKGQDIIPNVLKKLLEENKRLRWYCIGDGSLRDELKTLIEENKIEENLILLGSKSNPYPYIKNCDLYVQTSRQEGFCISLTEARILNKPIVTTNFAGAKEQIKDKQTGIIVNFNEDELYKAIEKILNNNRLRNEFILNLRNENFDKKNDLYKIIDLIK